MRDCGQGRQPEVAAHEVGGGGQVRDRVHERSVQIEENGADRPLLRHASSLAQAPRPDTLRPGSGRFLAHSKGMPHPSFPIRTAFRRLLGDEVVAYLLHLRPMEWPIMTAHFLLGTLLAAGLRVPWGATVLGWVVFVFLLNGGTLAINSAFDRDEGDIGYLRQPPKPPRFLLHVSVGMLAASLLLGLTLPPVFAWSNAACVAMAVLYSVPPGCA